MEKLVVFLFLVIYAIYTRTSIIQIILYSFVGALYGMTAGLPVMFIIFKCGIGKSSNKKKSLKKRILKNIFLFCFFILLNGLWMAIVVQLIGGSPFYEALIEANYWVGAFVATEFQFFMVVMLNLSSDD